MIDHAFMSGYASGITVARESIKELFDTLPAGTTMDEKNRLLDLYNDLSITPVEATE